jgi:hypothetical protein
VLECLPNKCEALNSNPSTIKKKKRRRRRKRKNKNFPALILESVISQKTMTVTKTVDPFRN